MHYFLKCILIPFYTLFFLHSAHASIPNTAQPTTFLGPTLVGQYTSPLTTFTAYSLSGYAGANNLRLSGTFGWQIEARQQIKLSAEYLWQQITYPFFSGNSNQWVQQSALGLGYQYDANIRDYQPQIHLNVFLSRAPSKVLHSQTGTFIDKTGIEQFYFDGRHLAGSDSAGGAAGVDINPWLGGQIGLDLNYDYLTYNTYYINNRDTLGLGATLRMKQALTQKVDFSALASVRKIYNNYETRLTFKPRTDAPRWTIGLSGEYTAGKNTLPNTYNVGIEVNYQLERVPCDIEKEMIHTNPAVYFSQVLVIAD